MGANDYTENKMVRKTNSDAVFESSFPHLLNITLIAYGMIAIIAQIVLMRELVSIFYGNELTMGIMLGAWLFWTAVGTGLLSRLVVFINRKMLFFLITQLVWTLLFALTLYMSRISLILLGRTPGEITGYLLILLVPFIILCPFCMISGFLYTLGCSIYSKAIEKPMMAIGRVYLLEAIGAGLGGFMVSFILIRFLTPFQIAFLLFLVSLCIFLIFNYLQWETAIKLKLLVNIFLLLSVTLIGLFSFSKLDAHSLNRFWRDFNLQRIEYSIYGSIALTKLEDSYSIYENGLLMFTIPDLFYAEESVHLALLEHPAPRKILLIGGGMGGSIQQVLQYPQVELVDYVELDPTVIQMSQTILSPQEKEKLNDPRIRFHHMDGRFFVKSDNHKYDVVIVNLPDPYSILINRFYTIEFYTETKKILNDKGILAFSVTSSENVISDDLSQFLSCLYNTLRRTFEEIILIPGNTCHFIACVQKDVLTENPDTLIERLKSRNLQTQFVREYYLPYRMSKERMAYLRSRIQISNKIQINEDFKPIAYYFDMILWSSYFSQSFRNLFLKISQIGFQGLLAIIGFLFLISLIMRLLPKGQSRSYQIGIFLSIFTVGYSEIGLEVILILAFQVLYGYAYYQVAFIITGYMVGLSLGSWLSNRRSNRLKHPFGEFRLFQLLMTLFPLFVTGMILLLARYNLPLSQSILIQLIFMLLISIAGFIGGYQFPLANVLYLKSGMMVEKTAGIIYGIDLVGSCMGALLTSAILIPLFGIFQTLIIFSLLNLVALINLLWTSPEVLTKLSYFQRGKV